MRDPLAKLAELIQDLRATEPRPEFGERIDARQNHILHMDNLQAIAIIPSASIDFIYIDPPFASNANYAYQIRLPNHTINQTAYTDRWEHGIASYLEFLVPRLAAMKPLLKPGGSICVHLDNHSSHYVKLAMDAIFGADRFINEVIWRYGKMSNTRRRFPQNHDTLLIYAASDNWFFQPQLNQPSEYRTRFERDLTGNQVLYGSVKHRSDKLLLRRIAAKRRELKRELEDSDILFDFDVERKIQDDVFTDISIVRGNAHEGVGYDTQKPQKLAERLISAFSPSGGVVADFFCGSGTTGAAAQHLGRRWILADRGLPAIQTTRLRLKDVAHEFARDSSIHTPSFDIAADGTIVDFRLHELPLAPPDIEAVQACLENDPQSLIAGKIGNVCIDVFGREATASG